jgi:uncharacterized membrane protein YkoI
MRTIAMALLAGTLSLGGSGGARADEDEAGHHHQSVTMAELPAAVQKTLNREAKGGKIEELRKETRKDGKVIYEAEIVKNGKGTDIDVSAEGKVLARGHTHDESSEHGEK